MDYAYRKHLDDQHPSLMFEIDFRPLNSGEQWVTVEAKIDTGADTLINFRIFTPTVENSFCPVLVPVNGFDIPRII